MPVPKKFIAVVLPPLNAVWLAAGFTVNNAFRVPLTATFLLVTPADVSTTFPDIFPAGAVAADRTYITVLSTTPAVGVRVTVPP